MGPFIDCIDIITELGGIKDIKAAQKVFKDRIDAENLDKLKPIQNPDVLKKLPMPSCSANLMQFLSIRDRRKTVGLSESFR